MRITHALVVCAACLTMTAAEQKMKVKDLPAPVQQTVQDETRNAQLLGVSKEVEGGKTMYEIETKVGGMTRDLLVDAAGKVVEVEQEVAMDTVPAAARTAIEGYAKGGKVVKVESVTKGSVVSYEAAVSKGGKKSEVAVTADGTIKKN